MAAVTVDPCTVVKDSRAEGHLRGLQVFDACLMRILIEAPSPIMFAPASNQPKSILMNESCLLRLNSQINATNAFLMQWLSGLWCIQLLIDWRFNVMHAPIGKLRIVGIGAIQKVHNPRCGMLMHVLITCLANSNSTIDVDLDAWSKLMVEWMHCEADEGWTSMMLLMSVWWVCSWYVRWALTEWLADMSQFALASPPYPLPAHL